MSVSSIFKLRLQSKLMKVCIPASFTLAPHCGVRKELILETRAMTVTMMTLSYY